MKPFDERKAPTCRSSRRSPAQRGRSAQIAAATIIPFNLPPIIGLSTRRDLSSSWSAAPAPRPPTWRPRRAGWSWRRKRAGAGGVYTTYGASTPQIYLDLDRERAQILGVEIADVFNALQTAMGGYYANDFNLFGRTWQVKIQAEAADRRSARDVYRVRTADAAMASSSRCAPWRKSGW